MSEFPWEVKKDSSKESSGKNASDPANSGVAGQSGASPSIPDILANAFAGAPMEEIKLEPLPSSEIPAGQSIPFNPPGFGNLADIPELLSNNAKKPEAAAPSQTPGNLPPFMQVGGSDGVNGSNAEHSSSRPFKIEDISFNPPGVRATSQEQHSAQKKTAKKSPPPLFMPVLPGDEVPESPVCGFPLNLSETGPDTVPRGGFTFPPIAPASGNEVSPGNPFPDQLSISDKPLKDIFPSQGASLQDKLLESGNPFPEMPPSSEIPFTHNQNVESPFPASMPNFDGPLPDYVEPSANPFSGSSSVGTPEENPAPQIGDPFLSSFGSPEGTHSGPSQDSNNPFLDSMPSTDPFSGLASVSADPFSTPAQKPFSPFPDFPSNAGNPFPEQGSTVGKQASPLGRIGSLGASIKIDSVIRNLDDVGVKVKSLLSGLTKGQSLIERMDGLAGGENVVDKPDAPSPFDEDTPFNTPFPSTPSQIDDPFFSPSGPAIPDQVNAGGMTEQGEGSPFAGTMEQTISGEIRKVTPVAGPLMEIKEEQRIDFSAPDEGENLEVPSFVLEDGISNIILMDIPEKEKKTSHHGGSLSVGDISSLSNDSETSEDLPCLDESIQATTLSEDEIVRMNLMSSDIQGIRSELEIMLSRFEDVEGNVLDLSQNVAGFGPLLANVKDNEELMSSAATKVDSFGGKVDILESKVYGLENALVSVQSDNEGIRSSLSRIEENIAELVSSYTALLVQVHESAQENDSRFLAIESALEALEPLGSRLSTIEKSQDEARSTSMELARSVSSLVDELGTNSSELEEFKGSCELRQDKLEKSLSSVTEYLDSELKKLGARSYKGFGQNVHLSNIMKNSSNMKLCMEWLEFLMEMVGRNNLPDILSYYEELGWITEEVRSELLHYAEGIDFYMEKPDWKLTPDDHVKSIWFIESLAGMKVDKNRLSVIDRDIEKVKKGNEIYGI